MAQSNSKETDGTRDMEEATEVADSLVLPTLPKLPCSFRPQDLVGLLEVEEQGKLDLETSPDPETDISPEVDEDEIWKKFVFDEDTSEISRRALQEAQEQTRRQLYPLPETLWSDTVEPPSLSHRPSSTSPAPSTNHCLEYVGDSGISKSLHAPAMVPPEILDLASSLIAQTGSPSRYKRDAEFRFRQPRQFIGRLASSAVDGSQELRRGTPMRARGRGRRRRRDSGRPDIRALPNFDGDPIEESL